MAARHRFADGLRLDSHKSAALQRPLRTATPPACAVVAVGGSGARGSSEVPHETIDIGPRMLAIEMAATTRRD